MWTTTAGWISTSVPGFPNFDALMPNAMYRNRQGQSFEDVAFAGGFAHLQKGHGVAFGDLDNDGDQDLFHQLGGAFLFDGYGNALFENPGNENHWLVLRLEGRQSNRRAVGARITLQVMDRERARTIHRQVGSGGSFGGSSLQQEIGLGTAAEIESLIIDWPGSGQQTTVTNVAADRFYLAIEGESQLRALDLPRLQFQDHRQGHSHDSKGNTP